MSQFCKSCQHINLDIATYCANCGTKLIVEKKQKETPTQESVKNNNIDIKLVDQRRVRLASIIIILIIIIGMINTKTLTQNLNNKSHDALNQEDITPIKTELNITLDKIETIKSIDDFSLSINTIPFSAKINVLNIKSQYHDGIKLKEGQYHIEVSNIGYKTIDKWIYLNKNTNLNITLFNKPVLKKLKPLNLNMQKEVFIIKEESSNFATLNKSISAKEFIKNYYKLIQDKQYLKTWAMLTDTIKYDQTFDTYIDWWNKQVKDVYIIDIEQVSATIVKAKLNYSKYNGKEVCSEDAFTLVNRNSQWFINKQTYKKCVQPITNDSTNINFSSKLQIFDTNSATITVNHPISVKNNQSMNIEISMQNHLDSVKGRLSISFPQYHDSSFLESITNENFETVNSYPAGSKIYSGKLRKNIKSKYLLIEGWDYHWNYDDEKKIILTISPPYQYQEFIILIRGVLISNDIENIIPENGLIDQQSYENKVIKINIVDDI